MNEIDKQIENTIDEIFSYAKSLYEEKENAKNNGGSFLSVGMRNSLKQLKYASDDLNKHMHEY